jgi:iron complex transport system ATP-binding protein
MTSAAGTSGGGGGEGPPLVEARQLHFRYGDRAVLGGVDLAVTRGELVALLGPNGAGKSTLLQLLLGWLSPTSGEIRVSGTSARSLTRREIARRVAFVPQDVRVDFAFTVRELVAMGRLPHLGRFRAEGREDQQAVERALAATELVPFAERSLLELSGGERQRAHLGRALAQDADLLLLDEPTASLDIEHQLAILGLVRELAARGKGAVVALHDLSLAARFATRVVVLSGGRVVASGPPGQVVTVDLLRSHFHIHARIREDEAGRVEISPLGPASPGLKPDGPR